MKSISFIIPAYNEETSIIRAIDAVVGYATQHCDEYEVLVVDDGSTDKTRELASGHASSHVQLISHAQNKGKGAAVKTGVEASSKEWIVFLDADLSTKPEDVAVFTQHTDADIIIGSRALPDSILTKRQPKLRELQGRVFNKVIRYMLDIPFYDTQCGFKAFHKKTKHLFQALETSGWVFDVELLKLGQKNGYLIREVPISWHDDPDTRVKGSDIFNILRDLHSIRGRHK